MKTFRHYRDRLARAEQRARAAGLVPEPPDFSLVFIAEGEDLEAVLNYHRAAGRLGREVAVFTCDRETAIKFPGVLTGPPVQ